MGTDVGQAAPPGQSAPNNVSPPWISGSDVVGQSLSASPGSWSGPQVAISFQWNRCGSGGASCSPIASATSGNYTLTTADIGSSLAVSVIATNKNGSATATSSATSPVTGAPAPPTTTTTPTTATTPTTTTTTKTTTTTPTPTTTTTTTTPTTTTTTTPSPASPYFVGDFNTCNLSQWQDFHDADLSAKPAGVIAQLAGNGVDGCYAQVNDTSTYSTSLSGDISYLWEGNGTTNYSLPWLQNGSDTWFRMHVLFPDGTNSAYPGKFTVAPLPSGWDYVEEWHSCVAGASSCVCSAGYSTSVQVHGGATGSSGSDPNTLALVPIGGNSLSQTWTWLYQTDGTGSRIPLKYNHWYDIVVHMVFGTSSQTGLAEWWVDGVLQSSVHVPTISYCSNGVVPGLSHQVGLYRGPSASYTDTLYIDGVVDGPSRASVGG